MVAAGLQTSLPRGVELTARLTTPSNTGAQHVKIERKGRDNRARQEGEGEHAPSSVSAGRHSSHERRGTREGQNKIILKDMERKKKRNYIK